MLIIMPDVIRVCKEYYQGETLVKIKKILCINSEKCLSMTSISLYLDFFFSHIHDTRLHFYGIRNDE